MSHFTVLVVLPPNPPVNALVEALQPFHEFECTGTKDEHVVFVDEHDELMKEWKKPEERWQDPEDGTLYASYDDVFLRPATKAEKAKIGSFGGSGWAAGFSFTSWYHRYKEGDEGTTLMVRDDRMKRRFKKVMVSGEQAHPEGFAKWAKENHGGELVNGRWGRWTNPNKQWDWWAVGGRWSGLLLLKQGAVGHKGKPGLNPNIGSPNPTAEADPNGFDIARVGDVDLATMKIRNVRERRKCIDAVIAEIVKANGITREEVMARWASYCAAVVEARQAWDKLPKGKRRLPFWQHLDASQDERIRSARAGDRRSNISALGDYFGANVPEGTTDLEAYITSAPALSTFAVLKDGKWHQRGGMGWWGVVHDEEDAATWNAKFEEMLAGLDPDSVIAVVDCHI